MALSVVQLNQIRMMLGNLSLRSRRDLRAALRGVDRTNPRAMQAVLSPIWGDIIGTYGGASEALGRVMFQIMADDIKITPAMVMAEEMDTSKLAAAHKRMRWAVYQPKAEGLLENILDEIVKQPARDVIRRSR